MVGDGVAGDGVGGGELGGGGLPGDGLAGGGFGGGELGGNELGGGELGIDNEYVLEGFAVPDEINAVHGLLARAAGENPSLDSMDVMLFETAIIEIANNVVEHGQPIGEVRWKFTVRVRQDEIEAELDDTGQMFTPKTGAAMPDEDAEGGRGLPLAEALLDQIDFRRMNDTNHWRMVRRLGQAPQF